MPWTEITRSHYDRRTLLYVSDSTDEEWALVPPITTVQYYFYQLRGCGLLDILNDTLGAARVLAGRDAAPPAGIIDSQSVKTTESGGPRGFMRLRKQRGESATS